MFTIPSNSQAFSPNPQSIWMEADIRALEMALGGEGVVSGCVVSAQSPAALAVDIASGTVRIGGSGVAVGSGSVSLAAADPNDERVDLIVVDDQGTLSDVTGTPEAVTDTSGPEAPSIPANSVMLAMVFVPAGATETTAVHITDKRIRPQRDELHWPIEAGAPGDPAPTQEVIGDTAVLTFSAAASEIVYTKIPIPTEIDDSQDLVVRLEIAPSTGEAADFRVHVDYGLIDVGEALDAALTTLAATITPDGTAKLKSQHDFTIPASAIAGGDTLRLKIWRDHDHADDTHTGSMHLVTVEARGVRA